MENTGVACSVCECAHYMKDNKCNLSKIEVTNEKTGADSVSVPHFCKSYRKK
jgi:hypothetical protein